MERASEREQKAASRPARPGCPNRAKREDLTNQSLPNGSEQATSRLEVLAGQTRNVEGEREGVAVTDCGQHGDIGHGII